ncbi:flagellar assembly protein FliH [Alkalimonas amylolytica]|uniref:Flagellar assembly protein FliH n=1 Tax=Alkalimonas amylolytica TaxID=152573 RepID=A0A1H4BN61_ALKAM|nr:flagellar assembly protein FliH [Alkalimonas amylolytica]SEA49593.1 flagellar assembly protein FliH [Alkalimonas amylolytica]
MSSDQFRYKRPFSPDASTLEQLKEWPSPDLTGDMRKYEKTNALNKTRPDPKAPAETEQSDEDDHSLKPLTAEQMEELRQQAYDAGFSEGKEDGFAKGYEEGRQQGQEDGVKQGLAEGKKLGFEEGQQQSEQQFQALEQLLDQLQQPLKQLDKQVEQELLALALAMAKAVLQTEVQTNQQVILKALQQAIDALPLRHGKVHIKLHPDDLAIIQQHYSTEQLGERGWQLLAEPTLSRGGCRLETEQSLVDRSIEQRLGSALAHFMQLETPKDDTAEESPV